MPLPTNLVSTDGDCPLCGGPNGCDVAAGQDGGACWCMRASIPEAARARVPEHLRDRRCLCPTCAQTACAAQGSGCVASFS